MTLQSLVQGHNELVFALLSKKGVGGWLKCVTQYRNTTKQTKKSQNLHIPLHNFKPHRLKPLTARAIPSIREVRARETNGINGRSAIPIITGAGHLARGRVERVDVDAVFVAQGVGRWGGRGCFRGTDAIVVSGGSG